MRYRQLAVVCGFVALYAANDLHAGESGEAAHVQSRSGHKHVGKLNRVYHRLRQHYVFAKQRLSNLDYAEDRHVRITRANALSIFDNHDIFSSGSRRITLDNFIDHIDFDKLNAEKSDAIVEDLVVAGEKSDTVDHWKLYHGGHHYLAVLAIALNQVSRGPLQDADVLIKRAMLEAAIEHDRRDQQGFHEKPVVDDTIAFLHRKRAQEPAHKRSAGGQIYDHCVDFLIHATDFPDPNSDDDADRIVGNLHDIWNTISDVLDAGQGDRIEPKNTDKFRADLLHAAYVIRSADQLSNYAMYQRSFSHVSALAMEEKQTSRLDFSALLQSFLTGSYNFLTATAPVNSGAHRNNKGPGVDRVLDRFLERIERKDLLQELSAGLDVLMELPLVGGSSPLANYGRTIGIMLSLKISSGLDVKSNVLSDMINTIAEKGLWMSGDMLPLVDLFSHEGPLHDAYALGESIGTNIDSRLRQARDKEFDWSNGSLHKLVWEAITRSLETELSDELMQDRAYETWYRDLLN